MSLASLARALHVHKSVVSRALDAAKNVEIFTLFDFAEAVGKEWSFRLSDRPIDIHSLIATQSNYQTPSYSIEVGRSSHDVASTATEPTASITKNIVIPHRATG
jgi:hypothetical protein